MRGEGPNIGKHTTLLGPGGGSISNARETPPPRLPRTSKGQGGESKDASTSLLPEGGVQPAPHPSPGTFPPNSRTKGNMRVAGWAGCNIGKRK